MRINPRTMDARKVRSAFCIVGFLEMVDTSKVDKIINSCKGRFIVFVEKFQIFLGDVNEKEEFRGSSFEFRVSSLDLFLSFGLLSQTWKSNC